jgi:hypothetical protein
MADSTSKGQTQIETRSIELGLELRGEINHGAFGTVYRAWDRGLEREVALKTLRRDAPLSAKARQRFLTEARMLARMDHPNIVRIHAVDEVGGELHIRMELVKGRTLKQIVETDGPLSPEEAARIGCDLCRALATIHAQGLIHMDLKPANVMRAEGGRIVLLDFGFTRSDHPEAGQEDALGGTPLFSAPEQLTGSGSLTPAVDLYALGVLLYWLVTRSYPIEAKSLAQLKEQVERGEPRPLADACPTVPAEFDEIVRRCLARDPGQRPRSAGALERELRAFLGESTAPPRRAPGRRTWLAAAGIVVLAAVAALFAWVAGGPRPLDVQADLFVLRGDAPVLLAEGDPVAVGDRLFLEIRAAEDFYLYVFNEDEAERSYTLFPLTWQGDANPLRAGEVWRLPRGGSPDDPPYYKVSSAGGGAESFFVIAAREPLDVAETLRRFVPEARAEQMGVRIAELDPGERADLLRSLTRGVGTVTQAAAPAPAEIERLRDLLDAASPGLRRAFVKRIRLSSQ